MAACLKWAFELRCIFFCIHSISFRGSSVFKFFWFLHFKIRKHSACSSLCMPVTNDTQNSSLVIGSANESEPSSWNQTRPVCDKTQSWLRLGQCEGVGLLSQGVCGGAGGEGAVSPGAQQ